MDDFDGVMDGEVVGEVDGAKDGVVDGVTDGDVDGFTEGEVDGESDGVIDGDVDGCEVSSTRQSSHVSLHAFFTSASAHRFSFRSDFFPIQTQVFSVTLL